MKYSIRFKYIKNEKGIAFVMLAIIMFFLIFCVGLAIDTSHVFVVKKQLQNAADSGALAGAGVLYPDSSATLLSQLSPNWSLAASTAPTFVKQNRASGSNLTDADILSVKTGYWNLSQNPPGMQPSTTVPKYKCSTSGLACTPSTATTSCSASEACLQQDVPAVQVTVQKSGVLSYFAKAVGWHAFSPSATAVAARGNPLSAQLSFPFAVSKCMADYYSLHPSPATIQIPGVNPQDPSCNTGNWTSLTMGGGGDSVVQGLLSGSTPPQSISFGDNIQIQSGTKANLYGLVDPYIGQTVLIPVVADPTKSSTPVTGFFEFIVTGVTKNGSHSYISGQFVPYQGDPTPSGLGGAQSNTVTPPMLIK